MANRLKSEVDVQVGDRTLTLVYAFAALAEIEDRFGKPFIEFAADLDAGLSMKDVPPVFWFGLRRNHPDITEAEALELCEQLGVTETLQVIGAAFLAAFPPAEAAGLANPPVKADPPARLGRSRPAGTSGKA